MPLLCLRKYGAERHKVTAKTVQRAARPVILAFMGFISFHPTDKRSGDPKISILAIVPDGQLWLSEGSDSDHGCVARRPPVADDSARTWLRAPECGLNETAQWWNLCVT
jgi:hypothetical protein